MKVKKLDIEKYLFFLMMSVTLPNPYLGTIIAIFILSIKLLKSIRIPKLMFKNEILLLVIVSIGIMSFLVNYSHIQNLFWGLFTFSSFIIYPLILKYHYSEDKLENTFKLYLIVQGLFFFVQGIIKIIQNGSIDIFGVSIDAGDVFVGTGYNSHQIALSIAFISFYFLNNYLSSMKHNYLFWYIISIIMFILPSYVSSIIIYFFTIILTFAIKFFISFINAKISKNNFKLALFLIPGIIVMVITQIGNIYYGYNLITKIVSLSPPRKILAIQSTISDFSKEKWYIPIIGVGIGNYSSRAAFIVSGEYLRVQPKWIPPTPSDYTKQYMIPLWNKELLASKPYMDGVSNQPFIQIQAIYGEMGLAGLILFFVVLTRMCFLTRISKTNYMSWFLYLFCLGTLLLDMWIEYPSFALFFWLFVINQLYNPKLIMINST